MKYNTIEERFWSKVQKGDGCWEWVDSLNNKGYGQFGMNGTMRVSSRVAYELAHGFIPMGMSVLHHCDNSKCCRPDHLFLGTQRDNMQDMSEKGRATRGERDGQTKLTADQVVAIRKEYSEGKKVCQLVRDYGVCNAEINRILTGKRWKHIQIAKTQRMPLPRYSSKYHYPPELRHKACDCIKSGVSYKETAILCRVHESTIAVWCKEANVESPRHKRRFTEEQKELIKRLLKEGNSLSSIARELGSDYTAIKYWATLWCYKCHNEHDHGLRER